MPHQIPLAKNTSTNKFQELKVDTKGNLEVLSIPDKNGYSQVLLGTSGATTILGDSTITPTADPEGRDGWNFTNSVAGTKFNLYYFNGNQEVITLGDINSLFTKLYINNFASLSGSPFFNIYTKPTGSGDAGAFYHSRIDYEINSDVLVGIGEQVILYAINKPNISCNNRLIELKTKTINGDGADSEEILYITLSTNSSATINEKNITVSSMGFNTVNLGVDKGVVNRDFKLIAGSTNGATETTLSALNNKITQGEADVAGGGSGLQQILCYGKDQSGNLDPLNVDNNGHLKITVNDIESGIANALPVSSSQLPASLGQKANASSISTCRSSTTGAYDLSGRTTIATASTSTKLLCDSDGHLQVDIVSGGGGGVSTSVATWLSTASISNGNSSASLDLSDIQAVQIFGDSGTQSLSGLHIHGSTDDITFYCLQDQIQGSMPLALVNSAVGLDYHQFAYIKNPPKYIRIYNNSGSTVNALTLKVSKQ